MINWDIEEVKTIIKNCKETNQEYFFKNFMSSNVTWDDVLAEMNTAWDVEDDLRFSRKANKHNHVHYGDRWDLIIENTGEPINIQATKDIRDALTEIYDEDAGQCFLFVNLLNKANTMIHKDDSDNFQWVCVGGPVIWTIGEEGQSVDYTLEVGDLIFIPYKKAHSTIVERRASVNMNFNPARFAR